MIYTIKVTGTLETGDTVWMRIKPEGGTAGQWIQATKNADGTYSVNHNDADHALTDGRYTIETVVRDAAGNPSTPSTQNIEIDTQGPTGGTVTISGYFDDVGAITGDITTSGTSTDDTTPLLKGTVTGLQDGDRVVIKVTGSDGVAKVLGTATVTGGTWSYQVTDAQALSEGDYKFEAIVTDKAGNEGSKSGLFDLNVDTTAPAAIDTSKMDLVDDFGPVQGTINRGDPTDDRTPTYSGAAGSVDANDASSINIYNKDASGVVKLIGSTSVNADGSWSFDPNPPLTPGDYIFSARPVDKAGNEGPATTDWNFTLVGDAPADPAITSVSDNEGSVQGALQKNGVTDDTTPVVKGTGEAGSTITIHVEGPDGVSFVGGTTTVNANGSWTIEITPAFSKGDGTYTIKAQANDSAGQLSNMTGGFPVVLDTTAPATPSQPTITDNVGDVTGALSANDTTDDKQPVLSGNAGSSEAGGTVTIKDGDTVLGTTSVGADGSWSFTPPAPGLSDGSHSITVTVTDKAGNESAASPAFNITVDTSNVVVSFSHFEDNVGTIQGNVKSGGISDDRTPVMVGSASANATVTVSYVNAAGTKVVVGTTTADSTGAWSLTPSADLSDGKYSFSAEAVNAAGVKGTVSFTLEIDATAPSAPVINEVLDDVGFIQGPITSGSSTDDTTPTFSGTGEVGSTITIKDKDGTVVGTTTVDSDGKWSVTADELAEGTHNLTVTSTDAAGNVSDGAQFDVIVDTTGPSATAALQSISDDTGFDTADFITNDTTLIYTIKVTGTLETGDTVWMRIKPEGGTAGQWIQATKNADGTYSVNHNDADHALTDGRYTIETVVRDAAGNPSTPSTQVVTIDTSLPITGYEVAITGFFDDVGLIQGDMTTSGTSTDDTTPLLKGTITGLQDGDRVVIKVTLPDGSKIILGVATVTEGTWEYQVTDAQAFTTEGQYSFEAVVTNIAGNEGKTSTGFDLNLDLTAPTATSSITGITDDTGFSDSDYITSDDTLIIHGSVSETLNAGEKVQIRIDGGTWVDAVYNATDKTWSYDNQANALSEGDHKIESRVVDAAGNITTGGSQTVTIDKTGPVEGYEVAISGFFDDVGLIQGDMTTSGTSTDDTTPLLKGTVTGIKTGDEVVIKVTGPDGTKIILGNATVTNGTWQYQVTEAQKFVTEGKYTFEAVVTDKAGNEGKTSTGFDLNLDLTAPTATSSITGITDDTGFSDSDYITSDDTLIIHGSVSETLNAGEKVQIRIDGGTWGDAVYNATDKTWSYDNQANALSEGDHTIESRVVDAAGNITTGGSQTVTIDKTGPVEGYEVAISGFFDDVGLIQGDMTTSGTSTDDTTPLLKGTVTGIKTGDEVVIKVTGPDGTKIILGNATVTNGTWQYQVTEAQKFVTEGKYTFEAVVTDKAGNEGKTSTGFDLNLDLTAPTATSSITGITDDTGFSDSDYITSDDTLIIHGSVSETLNAGEKVQIRIDGGTWGDAVYNATDKTWSYDNQANALSEGDHTIESRVVDAAGNITTGGSQTVTIDKTGPVEGYEVAISGFFDDVGLIQGDMTTSGTSTDDTTPLLKGTVTGIKTGDEVVIKVTGPDGTKIILGNATVTNGTWQYQVTEAQKFVTEGKYTFEAVVTDKAGNEGKTSTGFDLNLDLTAPTATSSITGITDDTGFSDSDYITSDDTLIIHGSVSETLNAGEKVQIRIDGGTWVDAVYNATDKTWSYDNQANALSEGDHKIESRVVDAAGNITTGGSQTVTIDKTAPIDGVSVSITGFTDDVGLIQGEVTANNSYTDDTEPLLKGTIAGVADGERVVIKVTDANGVTTVLGVAVVSAGTWEYQVTAAQAFKDGQYTFQAVVTDTAGNEGATSNQFGIIFDTAAPTALSNITSITEDTGNGTNDYVTRDGTLIISAKVTGTLSDNERVQISLDNGTTWRDATYAASTDSWTLDNTDTLLADGTYTFKTRVIDAAGNLGTESSQQVVIDNKVPEATTKITHFSDDQAPQVYDTLPSGSYTDDTTPTLHGTLTKELDEGAAIAIYRGSVFVGYATVTGTTWSFTQPTALSDGTFYTYYAAVQSRSGVNGSLSDAFEIAIDTTDSNMAPNVGIGGADATYSMSLRLGNNGGWTMMTDMAEYSADGNDFRDFGQPNRLAWGSLGDAAISSQYKTEKLFSSYTYGDYNRDGYMDMFLTDRTYDAGITGNGTGTMFVGDKDGKYTATLVQVNSLTHFGSTVSLDMDGDGWLDVVLGDSGSDSSTFLHNKGQKDLNLGTQQWDTYGFPSSPSTLPTALKNLRTDHELSAVDLNNDGAVDLAMHAHYVYSNEDSYDMVTLLNNGKTSATGDNWSLGDHFTKVFNSSGYNYKGDSFERTISMTWADLNGDGYMDLFLGQAKNAGDTTIESMGSDSVVYYNDGTGHLGAPQRLPDGIMGKSTLAIDWDGDGKMDIVVVPEAKYTIGTSLYYHNGGTKPDGQVDWQKNNIKDMGVATTGSLTGGAVMPAADLDLAKNGASAAAMDYDWDGDQDLIISRANTTEASIVITNPNTPEYGTAMHLRILRPDGSNTFYGNTVELYNSAGVRVSSQVLNPQYGTGWNDSSAIVHFYGLDQNETYTAVMRFNKNGDSQDFGGKAIVGDGSNVVENVNSSWTNLKATEPYNGYVLTAEADGAVNNTTDYSSSVGIVGTGYNDTFFIGAGTRFYNGGGGWNVGDGERTWDVNSGLDIADFAAVGSQGITVSLADTIAYQKVADGFSTRLFNIEAIYGTSGNDTITDGNGNNVLNGRGGNDTFTLTGTGHTTLLYENIDNADATAGNGQDVVNQFTLGNYVTNANADRIDLADILIGYVRDADGPAHFDANGTAKIDVGDNIGDYLRVVQDGGNAVLYVDRDGTGGTFQSTALLTLNNTTTDLATLLANGQIVV
ncbi:Ig-like domain-containing protein [Bartonella sp. HY038]|uniref:Ig-like domain-containing protein n=1 Tax=Bartonella sp. HY038 TaxID=2759660 RepID=UPI0015FC7FF3|nr:Ig-like domain-containing protein [Bartonella sp. HY038]